MESVRQLLGSDVYHLYVWDKVALRPVRTWATLSASDEIHHRYNAYYGLIDPRRVASDDMAVGEVLPCSRRFDSRFVAKSEFYQDFLLPSGLRYMLGVTLHRGPTADFKLGMLRALGRADYSDNDLALAQRIAAHLNRALTLMLGMRSLEEIVQGQERALGALDAALALLDEHGRLLHLSAGGDALLRRHGVRLSATSPVVRGASRADFESAWKRVCETGQPACVRLRERAAAGGIPATLMPVNEAAGDARWPLARFVLLLTEPLARGASATALQHAFELTAAEAALAHDLTCGLSLAESAARRGVRLSTARTQLLALFAKTDTHKQAQLVRLLSRVPAA